ncbi:MAG TPA: prolyl oligopeptidase family serine peptidase [Gemmataceae bacterium]|nr:prolyl oligopeptidase family serine peptidase [Gemmataceae bacterium]
MYRIVAPLFLLLAMAPPLQAGQDKSKPNTLTPAEIADGWILLFDGKTTEGWTGDKWKVDNGELVSPGINAPLRSAREFLDFELEFDCISDGKAEVVLGFGKYSEGEGHPRRVYLYGNKPGWQRVSLTIQDYFAAGIIYDIPKKEDAVFPEANIRTKNDEPVPLVFSGESLRLRNIKLKPLKHVTSVQVQPYPDGPPSLKPQANPVTLTQQVQKLRSSAKASAEVKTQVDKLLAEASSLQSAGRKGEACRPLAHAFTLLNGRLWNAKEEFLWSLALRTEKILADSSIPLMGSLGQTYAASYKPGSGVLRLTMALLPEKGGKVVKDIGVIEVAARDFVEKPAPLAMNLAGVPDGTYLLHVNVIDGEAGLCTLSKPIRLVQGLDALGGQFETRLAAIAGHESTKATIRYPFDLARIVNLGKRVLGSGDFGLDSPAYDFAKGMKHSAELLAALEKGVDPLWQAKGDNTRHYWFADADEIMPYRVFAPTTWDGKTKLPLLVVLHGNTRDHDYYFDRDNGILAKTAAKHGWLVVCPLGYHPTGGYGAGGAPGSKGKGKGGATMDPWVLRRGEFSEKDAMNVADLVAKEYDVDRTQIFLFGHSSGGTGTWHLGQKFSDKWAGIAISAGRANATTYSFDKLKGKAVILFHGDKDNEVPPSASRTMDKALKEKGIAHEYLEFKGATHATVVALAIPKVFEYFDKHRGK